jgi:hypothetical protein
MLEVGFAEFGTGKGVDDIGEPGECHPN